MTEKKVDSDLTSKTKRNHNSLSCLLFPDEVNPSALQEYPIIRWITRPMKIQYKMNVGVNGLIVQTLMKFAPGLMGAFVDYPFNMNVLPKACNVSEIDFILATSMIVRMSSLSRIAYISDLCIQ